MFLADPSNHGGDSTRTPAGRHRPGATAAPARSAPVVPSRASPGTPRRLPWSRPWSGEIRFGRPHSSSIERVTQPVVIAVGLSREFGDPSGVLVDAPEAPSAVGRDVHPRVPPPRSTRRGPGRAPRPRSNPFNDRPAANQSPRTEGSGSEQRVRVRCHRVRVTDQLHDLRARDEGEPPRSALQELLEAPQVEGKGSGRRAPQGAPSIHRRRDPARTLRTRPRPPRISVDEVVRVPGRACRAGAGPEAPLSARPC